MRTCINLLSPQKKKALSQGFMLAHAQASLLVVLAFTTLAAATTIGLDLQLRAMRQGVSLQLQTIPEEYRVAAMQIRDVNKYLRHIMSVDDAMIPFAERMRAVSEAAPAGIQIRNIQLNVQGITVSGVGATRDAVLAYQNALDALPFVSGVNYPLSNLLERKNVNFEFGIALKKN